MMDFDLDYEMNKYIDQQVDNYISLENLLSQHHLTYDKALQETAEFIEKYHHLMEQYAIGQQPLVRLCYDLTAQIRQSPRNLDLQYLYFCTVTDTGLLNTINGVQSGEQSIRNYLHQSEQVQNLLAFVQMETECKERLQEVKANLKHANCLEDTQEFPFLYELTTQHTFLYGAGKNPIYRDNLHSLLLYLNGNDKLKSIKPYLIFAVLSRKHGMMQNRVHFIPNLQTAFQYQEYQIYTANGKNFNLYQSYLELYDHLRRFYEEDNFTDILLCDFCFANFSPLSEWYYLHCQPDLAFPMNLKQKVAAAKSLSFPMLYRYEDYSDYDIAEFESEHTEICQSWDVAIDTAMTESFLQALYHHKEITEITSQLPYGEKYPRFAELFLYESAEKMLSEQMLHIAEILA